MPLAGHIESWVNRIKGKYMKTLLLILSLLFIISFEAKSEDILKEIKFEGDNYKYLIHLPKNYQSNQKYSLVLAFHGGGGNYEIQSKYYNWKEQADKSNFIVVFPNGSGPRLFKKLKTWNAGKCCGQASNKNKNHIGYIKALLNKLKNEISYDESRVFATGMSNGAMFSYRLACDLPGVFKGIAPVAGTINTNECNGVNEKTSLFLIHDINDQHVLFNGGCGPKCRTDVNYTSVPETIKFWTQKNSCGKFKNIIE